MQVQARRPGELVEPEIPAGATPRPEVSYRTSTLRKPSPIRTTPFRRYEDEDDRGPRSFDWEVKQACWEKAEVVQGRNPDRWRKDYLGNLLFRKLVACPGCLCHNYDHIIPFSKGGKSTLDNCQVLQATANRVKGNRMDISKTELIQRSAYCRLSGRDMDVVELSAYGDVQKDSPSGCFIS